MQVEYLEIVTPDVEAYCAATEAAEKAGGMVAHPPLEIPGQDEFSVVFIGGAQFGFWKNA